MEMKYETIFWVGVISLTLMVVGLSLRRARYLVVIAVVLMVLVLLNNLYLMVKNLDRQKEAVRKEKVLGSNDFYKKTIKKG